MKLVHMFLSVATISLVVLAPPVRAQMDNAAMGPSTHIISVGLGGGVSVPVSDAKDALKNGFIGHGFARLNLRLLPIAPRIDFTFSKFDLASAKLSNPNATGTGTLLAGMANVQLVLIPRGPVRPYIVAGVGAYNFKTEIEGDPSASTQGDTQIGLNGGGGVLFKLGSLISAFVEGRVENVYSKQGFVSADQIQVVPVTFGIVF
ncbi:MAG: hypothetical protein ABIU54_11825 [Candidatus Eisenbacteria bacterium]